MSTRSISNGTCGTPHQQVEIVCEEPEGHFDSVAGDYDKYRTTDSEPVNWLVQTVPQRGHVLCDLGCGTARYGFAVAERLREAGQQVLRLVGVDTSEEMLKEAEEASITYDLECDWVLASADQTGIAPKSVTLCVSFNSIHYLPFADTLSEVSRFTVADGHLAVYTRLREQEEEHVWGAWFPGYIDYSLVPTREEMERVPDTDSRFTLEASRDFRYPRESTYSWISEQTRKKFYSTFDRYPEDDFRQAYKTFLQNLRSNYRDLDRIQYWSSYSMWLYRVATDSCTRNVPEGSGGMWQQCAADPPLPLPALGLPGQAFARRKPPARKGGIPAASAVVWDIHCAGLNR